MLHSGETDADWPAESGELRFFSGLEALSQAPAWERYLSALPRKWVVYAKRPFGGPQQVLDYLGRYTHRVAISNQRLVSMTDGEVSFQWKDYRHEHKQNSKVMTISADEFTRRFLLHTLPAGFPRIRHFGFLANCHRKEKLVVCRRLLLSGIVDLLPLPAACAVVAITT